MLFFNPYLKIFQVQALKRLHRQLARFQLMSFSRSENPGFELSVNACN